MPIVTWKDVQYEREQHFYTRLGPVLADLQRKYRDFAAKTQQLEQEFFKHLSHSVKIDTYEPIPTLVKQLNQRLGTDLKISLFLFQGPVSNAMAIPRHAATDGHGDRELVVLVTQHFMNELTPEEVMSILAHELGHLLLGHVHIPAQAILESKFSLADIGGLKSDVLKWFTCREVSCDVIGLLGCDCNVTPFSRAMLKYTTGLADRGIVDDHGIDGLVKLLLDQLDEVSEADFDPTLSTHPLTPLRLKIAHEVANSELIKHFGQNVADGDLARYKSDFNSLIDAQVSRIYPEIFPQRGGGDTDVRFRLCTAVALADGSITPEEMTAITTILGRKVDSDLRKCIGETVRGQEAKAAVARLVDEAVELSRRRRDTKSQIADILKNALVVAASDGVIERYELEAIHAYAKHFGFSRQDIVALMGQMGLA